MPDRFEILDACSLINLYASDSLESILKSRPLPCCIVEQVKNESLFTRKPSDAVTGYEYQPITLVRYFQNDLLKFVTLDSEAERELFVNLAAQVDDGEAATIAVAISRNMQVVTDDKKVARVLMREAPQLTCLSTLDIVKAWSEAAIIEPAHLKAVLENIMKHANYLPSQNHPLFEWWQTAINTF